MNRHTIIIGFLILMTGLRAIGQTNHVYDQQVKKAEQHFQNKEYLEAAKAYSQAFSSNRDLGRIDHRYSAARCWALAGKADSAFQNLERIAKSGYYTKHYIITHDSSLTSLHGDQRWKSIVTLIKSNKEKSEPNVNEVLAAQLDTIYFDDQTYRKLIE